MGVQRSALCGCLLAAMSVHVNSVVKTEIMIPLYQFPINVPENMWIALREAALNEHAITGIMNPDSGPGRTGPAGGYIGFLHGVMGLGDEATYNTGDPKPTIICYVATGRGDKLKQSVLDEIDLYDVYYPGVCDGIFFDEAAAIGLTDDSSPSGLTTLGELYLEYNTAALAKYDSVTFNPGTGAEPVYFGWPGSPTVMTFENNYGRVKNVGVTRTPMNTLPSQNAMFVHGATEAEDEASLVKAMVEKAACSGWGKVYFTGSNINANPWDEIPVFWDDLVAEVSQNIDITCPESDQFQMRMMVPLLPNPVPSSAGVTTMVAPVLDELSKSDYGDVVSVVLDVTDNTILEFAAEVLRDAGARIMCYLDAEGLSETNDLYNALPGLPDVCGGFFFDNFDTTIITEADIDLLYANTQYKAARSTVVFKPADESATQNEYFYTNDWDEVSYQMGRVLVATVVDGATSTVPTAPGARANSAVMMTGFSGDPAECAIADMAAASYGYAYVTEAADFTDLSAYWTTLVAETTSPSPSSSYSCDGTETPTAPPTPTPTPSPTTAPPQSVPGLTACGSEPPVPSMSWFGNSRKLRIQGDGCVDMTRMLSYLNDEETVDVLSQNEEAGPGVWELDATIDVRGGSTVKIIGQDSGECNELRLISNNPRSRVIGIGGDIVIQDTQIFGWRDGEKDTNENSQRGYIYCASCSGSSSDTCTMSVTDSTIGNLGSGGTSSGGLSWKDTCSGTTSTASAQRVTIADNRRGIYAKGVDLDFDDITVTGGTTTGIHVDTCSGHISDCQVSPAPSIWGINCQRSPGIEIVDNVLTGTRGLYTADAAGVTVTGNTFPLTTNAARIRTTETTYSGNDGDEGPGSNIGLRVQRGGCFTSDSTSDDNDVMTYILSGSNQC